jgi:hypothetical protein
MRKMLFLVFLISMILISVGFAQHFFVGLETSEGVLGIGGGIDTPKAIIGGSLLSSYGITIELNFTNVLGNLYKDNNISVDYGWTSDFSLSSYNSYNNGILFGFGIGGSLVEHWRLQDIPLLFRQTLSLNTNLFTFSLGSNLGFYYEF